MPFNTQTGSEAAQTGVRAAQTSAAMGVERGKEGYSLTMQALSESKAVMVFPLIALSTTAIVEGLATYMAEAPAAKAAEIKVKALFAVMEANAKK